MVGNNATRKEQNNPALLKIKTDQSQQTCTFWVLQAINQFQQSRSITLGSQKTCSLDTEDLCTDVECQLLLTTTALHRTSFPKKRTDYIVKCYSYF